MLKGDLATTPLPEVLRSLAQTASTGCLRVQVGSGNVGCAREARVFLRTGRVYAVELPDRRPQLGPRLVSSGDLDPSALAEAYEAQRSELQGWRLGELLVHLGYVAQDVVEGAVGEQLRETAFELLLHTAGPWRFRKDERTREDVARPVDVEELFADVQRHGAAWEALRPRVHGPDAVPVLSAAGACPDTLSLDGDAWSLLCTVDGTSCLSELAGSSGLSLLEAAQVVVQLVDAGLVEVEPAGMETPTAEPAAEPVAEPVAEPPAEPVAEPPAVDQPAEPAAIASRLAEALRGLGPVPVLPPHLLDASDSPTNPAMASTAMDGEPLSRSLVASIDDTSVAGSISRASTSVAQALGDASDPFDPFDLPVAGVASAPAAPLDEREATRRRLDAEELAERHAALEAARAEQERPPADDPRLAAQLQAAAFAELTAAASAEPAAASAEPAAAPEPPVAEEPSREPDRLASGADTAALLRELSSLGLEDEPDDVPQQRAVAPPVVRPLTTIGLKKRKGLFARG